MPSIRLLVLAAASVMATAVASYAPAATEASGAGARHREAFEFVAKRTLPLPSLPTTPTPFVIGGDLYDKGGTTKIGTGYSQCATVAKIDLGAPTVPAICNSVFRFTEGSRAAGDLFLSGYRVYEIAGLRFLETTVGVTGGTGGYAQARGDGTVKPGGAAGEYLYALNLVTA